MLWKTMHFLLLMVILVHFRNPRSEDPDAGQCFFWERATAWSEGMHVIFEYLTHTATDWLKCFCIYRLKCSKAISEIDRV